MSYTLSGAPVPASPGSQPPLHAPDRQTSPDAMPFSTGPAPAAPEAPSSPVESVSDEKVDVTELPKQDTASIGSSGKVDGGYYDDGEEVRFVNGEPVITTGLDVSRFLIDTRDDGDPALTFRSLFLGTLFAGLGASLCQVRICLVTVLSPCLRPFTSRRLGYHQFGFSIN